jgi:hypothetical protein
MNATINAVVMAMHSAPSYLGFLDDETRSILITLIRMMITLLQNLEEASEHPVHKQASSHLDRTVMSLRSSPKKN